MKDIKFVNPYNFISLEQEKTSKSDFIEDNQSLTGYLDVSVNVKNSIIIPGKLDESTKKSDYYHYPNSKTPVLPGSQLRGAIRNVYETLTNSCLSSINTDKNSHLYRRISMGDSRNFKPFILRKEDGDWYLIECKKYKPTGNVDVKSELAFFNNVKFKPFDHVTIDGKYKKDCIVRNRKVFIDCVKYVNKNENSDVLVNIGNINTHNHYSFSVFEPIRNGIKHKLTSEDMRKFLLNIELYEKNTAKSKYKEYYERYNIAYKKGNSMTVYANIKEEYSNETHAMKTMVYISPANIGRKVSYNNLSNCYKGYESCDNVKTCCPGCSMFGFVGEKNKASYTGKVRFMDFLLSEDSHPEYTDRSFVSLEPKIANFNFYSTGKDWDEEGIRIRGRKYYWHNKELVECQKGTADITSTYKSIDKKDKLQFNGKIYFKDLTKKELEYFIFAICLGNDDEHMHHIGHAKPFGYGSVSVKCENLYLRHIDTSNDNFGIVNEKVDINDYLLTWKDLPNKKYIKELEKITNYTTTKDLTVKYPYLLSDSTNSGFSWFGEYSKTPLPYIDSDDICLSALDNPNKKGY